MHAYWKPGFGKHEMNESICFCIFDDLKTFRCQSFLKPLTDLLPIYRAIQKIASLQGGTTMPWKVMVLENGRPVPYVVKFFNPKDIDDAHHVAREVFSNAIAADLDLSVPDPALIEFDDAFLETLSEQDLRFVTRKDQKLKFGSKFIEGAVQYTPRIHRNVFERYDYENVYAFDNLIHNVDRKVIKPNILLHDDGYHLIDHELTLPINFKSIQNVRNGVSFYDYRIHIFYKLLRRARKESKMSFFESFEEQLRYMRPIEKLRPLLHQLEDAGHPVGDFDTLIEYLTYVKQNPTKFTGILKAQIL